MEIIPVIDLKGGQAVHARQGRRDAYQPVSSSLCRQSAPLAVVQAYQAVYPFRSLYVADLDAIQGRGDNASVVVAIARAFPDLTLWLDSGFCRQTACRRWLDQGPGKLVLGSESQSDLSLLRRLLEGGDAGRVVLSLDFRAERFMGPQDLLDRSELWPDAVIVMTLARVGSGSGPDLERLAAITTQAGERRVYAAGGLRDAADLTALQGLGIAGVLVATALHDGRIDRDAIAAVAD
ncbi:MAG: HisA/HisF-related TIM barrel protein [Kiloniellales bacterium]